MKYSVGDIVTLKSSGPQMTVSSFDVLTEDNVIYTCIWFRDGVCMKGYFSECTLRS